MSPTPPSKSERAVSARENHYRRLTADTNSAMSAILEKLSGLTHDAKMEVMRKVLAYGEAEAARAMFAAKMKAQNAAAGAE